ncbi:MAG TPA: UvrD-helicase domain-containing protein [Candidatus Paceibacterota bacterium]
MPQTLNVTEDDIAYAESILLPDGQHFDQERRDFITNLEILDLQAVPGSGKTTALLAKLLILDRYLPFADGSGILVISHTNAAIDEIKDKIGKYCSHLFSYPNFVGTIQIFVDKFIATPFYVNKYGKKVFRIDDQSYYQSQYVPGPARAWLGHQFGTSDESKLFNIKLHPNDLLASGYPPVPTFADTTNATAVAILALKKQLREKGYLSFEDAFILAFEAIDKYPQIKTLLQKRFRFVFVDEVQDMDSLQYDILEKLFYSEGASESVYQRIGDKNQSIFSDSAKANTQWVDRPTVLELNGSHRLNPKIAQVVVPFGLQNIAIVGHMKNGDGSEIDIKPHIIVYTDANISQVISRFAEMIKAFQDEGKITNSPKNKYRAIGWNTKVEANKTRIGDYHPTFSKDARQPKIDCDCLEAYLSNIKAGEKTFEPFKKNIINAIIRILRLENIVDENDRFYTRQKFLSFLSEQDEEVYDSFKLKLAEWSFRLIKGQKDQVLTDIKTYLVSLLALFGKEIAESRTFIDTPHAGTPIYNTEVEESPNIYNGDGIKVEVATIHSVKGQTHTATLYLETNYHQQRTIAYESQRLSPQFKGTVFNDARIYHKESTKMMYVGLSRPTHLLCVAIHNDRYTANLSDIDQNQWEIIVL